MMNTDARTDDAISVLGHSEEERRRLIDQADFFAGFSERLFVNAGGPACASWTSVRGRDVSLLPRRGSLDDGTRVLGSGHCSTMRSSRRREGTKLRNLPGFGVRRGWSR